MRKDALAYAISCTCFGILIGWVLGSQRAGGLPVAATAPTAASAPSGVSPTGATEPPPLDVQRAADLKRLADAAPNDAAPRIELANLYFDAERFDQAQTWYEAAVKLNPKDINASTDLAVCYYYLNQVDRAIAQIDKSLALDPRHAKTLLNQGIILAFGRNDLNGAAKSWQKVLDVAPGTPEAARAKQGLDGITSAHGAAGAGSGRGGTRP